MEQTGAPGGMTQANLIRALQEECRIEKIKAEDFLNALYDLCAETLKTGRNITLGKIGSFAPRTTGKKPAIMFTASAQLRADIGLPEKYDGPLCVVCRKNPRAPRRRDCHTCKKRKERANAKNSKSKIKEAQ